MADQNNGSARDFINGLFLGSLLGSAYVYFFHTSQGRKLFNQFWENKEELWQRLKTEIEKQEEPLEEPAKVQAKKLSSKVNQAKTAFFSTYYKKLSHKSDAKKK